MFLIDRQIRELCDPTCTNEPMLDPFSEGVSGNGVISYGLSHSGYDLRLGGEVWFFDPLALPGGVVDPKGRRRDEAQPYRIFQFLEGDKVVIPPGGYILGRSYEYFRMPPDVMGLCYGKSTLARCGLVVNVTPIECGWNGHLTIEIENANPLPAVVYCMEGVCQVVFARLPEPPERDYAAKGGKYQGQTGVTPARVL